MISFNVKTGDIWEGSMTIRSEVKTENNRFIRFRDIREGVTLWRSGCIIKLSSVQMVANHIKWHICLTQEYLQRLILYAYVTLCFHIIEVGHQTL